MPKVEGLLPLGIREAQRLENLSSGVDVLMMDVLKELSQTPTFSKEEEDLKAGQTIQLGGNREAIVSLEGVASPSAEDGQLHLEETGFCAANVTSSPAKMSKKE